MLDYRLLGTRIKKTRTAAHLTQEIVADRADITVVYLSKIENGKVKPTLDTLSRICTIIDCDIGHLLTDVNPESCRYQSEQIVKLFNHCSPEIKPVVIDLVRKLSSIQ